jgi:hypothetical protein
LDAPQVLAAGGKEMFPFLVDENTGTKLYESADIVKYLCATYGEGASPPPYLLESTLLTGMSAFDSGKGLRKLFADVDRLLAAFRTCDSPPWPSHSPHARIVHAPLPPLRPDLSTTGWMPTLLRAGRGMTRFERAAPPPRGEDMLRLYR